MSVMTVWDYYKKSVQQGQPTLVKTRCQMNHGKLIQEAYREQESYARAARQVLDPFVTMVGAILGVDLELSEPDVATPRIISAGSFFEIDKAPIAIGILKKDKERRKFGFFSHARKATHRIGSIVILSATGTLEVWKDDKRMMDITSLPAAIRGNPERLKEDFGRELGRGRLDFLKGGPV